MSSMSSESLRSGAEVVADRDLFSALIRAAATNTAHGGSVLADSRHQCSFADIPAHLESIQRFLAAQGIDPDDCVTLEVNNSVRGALAVLAMLDAGYSFMTLPVPGQGARAGGNAIAAPQFSRWIVTVNVVQPAASIHLEDVTTCLTVKSNPEFDPAATAPGSAAPRLFFRTSGSLGDAKLAMHGYRRFYFNSLNAFERRGFNPTHRIALPTPIFHLYGLGAGLLPGLAGGASIDFQERSNVLKYLEREAEFGPNVAYVTPSFCETLIRGRRSPRPYLFMITSGDRISDSAFRRCEELHGPLVNQYGTTEMGVVSASELHMNHDLRSRTTGRPVRGVEYRIVGSQVSAATEGEAGELQIRHAYGFEGYVDLRGNRLVIEKAFDGEWYRTGDLAAAGPDGTLRVLGRCDLSVNRGGVLLPLADVESRMREIDAVEEVAVATGPDNLRGRSIVAFCVTARGASVTGSELRASFAKQAPPYSVPDTVHVLASLPKLASGKVDRQALTRMAAEMPASSQN